MDILHERMALSEAILKKELVNVEPSFGNPNLILKCRFVELQMPETSCLTSIEIIQFLSQA